MPSSAATRSRVGCSLQPRRSVPSHLRQGPNLPPPVEPLQGDAHQDVRRPRARGSRRRRRRGQRQRVPEPPRGVRVARQIGTASRDESRAARGRSRAHPRRAPDLPLPTFLSQGRDVRRRQAGVLVGRHHGSEDPSRFRGHDSAVNAVRRRRRLAVREAPGSDRARARLRRSINACDPIQTISAFRDAATSLAVSDTRIVAGSVDGTVRTFDVRARTRRTSAASDAGGLRGDIRRPARASSPVSSARASLCWTRRTATSSRSTAADTWRRRRAWTRLTNGGGPRPARTRKVYFYELVDGRGRRRRRASEGGDVRVRLAPKGVRHGHELDGRNREGVGAARGKGSGKISGSVAIFQRRRRRRAGAFEALRVASNIRSRAPCDPPVSLPLRPRRSRARAPPWPPRARLVAPSLSPPWLPATPLFSPRNNTHFDQPLPPRSPSRRPRRTPFQPASARRIASASKSREVSSTNESIRAARSGSSARSSGGTLGIRSAPFLGRRSATRRGFRPRARRGREKRAFGGSIYIWI